FAGTRKALAEQLGLSERTLYRRMKALGLGTRER
ncbi:helix-turn-helix domain-containing protein, partial [Burkholderia cenocepacia]